MHVGSRGSALRPLGWTPDSPKPRSREDAEKLAREILGRVRAKPESFEGLARQFSDDVVTRETGGSLGGVSPADIPDVFCDALAVLQPGDISDIIQTQLGYHILLRQAPPPAARIRGSRIVIRYNSTIGTPSSPRSRDEALALADRARREALDGIPFEDLVAKYSEDQDKVLAGDLGGLSTRHNRHSLVTDSLLKLKEGEISNPIDTRNGIQLVKRTPLKEIEPLAGRILSIPYPRADPDARRTAEQTARDLKTALDHDPRAGVKFSQTFCCTEPVVWDLNEANPSLSIAVNNTQLGQVAYTEIDVESRFVVVQRIDPSLMSARLPPLLDLPAPNRPDIQQIVKQTESASLMPALRTFESLAFITTLDKNDRKALQAALKSMREVLAVANSPDERERAYCDSLLTARKEMTQKGYAELMMIAEKWTTEQAAQW